MSLSGLLAEAWLGELKEGWKTTNDLRGYFFVRGGLLTKADIKMVARQVSEKHE
jgi:hypothetical protein